MGTLIPGAVLIYERVDGTVYARYRDPPHNKTPRWEIGSYPDQEQQPLINYIVWQEINEAAQEIPAVRDQLDKLYHIFLLTKP